MTKTEYIEMLVQENTPGEKQAIYNEVIDTVDLALSQEPATFEVKDMSLGLPELFGIIEAHARSTHKNCVGPFEAAELFAKRLSAKYVRPSRGVAQIAPKIGIVNLEDFF